MARDKVIVYNGDDGKCRVVIPTYDCALADDAVIAKDIPTCLLYTSPSPRDLSTSRMPSSA